MNANVAMWTIGLVACLFVASRPRAPALLRGLLAWAGAGLLARARADGPEPRLGVRHCPWRWRSSCHLPGPGPPPGRHVRRGRGRAGVSGPMLAVHDEYSRAKLRRTARPAPPGRSCWPRSFSLCWAPPPPSSTAAPSRAPSRQRRIGVAAAILVAGALVAGLAVFTIAKGSPTAGGRGRLGRLQERRAGPAGGRVALRRRRHQPLRLLDRRVGRVPRSPGRRPRRRELPGGLPAAEARARRAAAAIRTPLELGVLSPDRDRRRAACYSAASRWRSPRPFAPGPPRCESASAAAAATAIFVYWLLHASVDWFWEFPGLTAPALACLGLAAALAPRASAAADSPPVRRPAVRRAVAVATPSCLSCWRRASPCRGSPRGRWTTPRGPGARPRRRLSPARPCREPKPAVSAGAAHRRDDRAPNRTS